MSNLVSAMVIAVFAAAGPLDPPAGPITPTPGPEPSIPINAVNTPGDSNSQFRISTPGSYYLQANIDGPALTGIEIAAANVTLDLGGFALQGRFSSSDGIRVEGTLTNIKVVNGTLTGWQTGINMSDGPSSSSANVFENLTVSDCQQDGIDTGRSSIVRNCIATRNAGGGFRIGSGSVVSQCAANSNAQWGFLAVGSSISNCSATRSEGSSLGDGFFVTTSTLSDCMASDVAGIGFVLNSSTAEKCSSFRATSHGFSIDASIMRGCSAISNLADGVRIANDATIQECLARGNTSAGFRVTGAGSRLEQNQANDNARGFSVDASGNFLVRNSASGNVTAWFIVASNAFGPILDRRAPGSAAVNGFSASTSLGTIEPNANFSY